MLDVITVQDVSREDAKDAKRCRKGKEYVCTEQGTGPLKFKV